MTERLKLRSTWLAWALCGLVTLGSLANMSWQVAGAKDPGLLWVVGRACWAALPIAFALPAALIVARQPGNLIGWLLMGPAIVLGLPADGYLSQFTSAPAAPTFPLLLLLWFQSWLWLLIIMPVLFVPLLFPTGRPPSPRWRWVIALGLAMSLFLIFLATFFDKFTFQESWSVANPIGFMNNDPFETPAVNIAWSIALMVVTVSCVAALFVRFRRAGTVERQQIKWLLYACALFALVYVTSLFATSDSSFEDSALVVDLFFPLSFLPIPIAIALAILRYRLWDIDVIIRKTLVYAGLTALLGLVYAGSVILLQQLFEVASGQQSPLAVVLSTLLAAALFAPLRRRVQDAVDRRFYRRTVDAAAALATFVNVARDETDLDALVARLAGAVQETMQPEGVSLWLREGER